MTKKMKEVCGDLKIVDLSIYDEPAYYKGTVENECIVGTSKDDTIYGGGGNGT